jgi:hypothetical protein
MGFFLLVVKRANCMDNMDKQNMRISYQIPNNFQT